MPEQPDAETSRATLNAYVARAEYPNTSGPQDLDALGEQAQEAAELLDDLDSADLADQRAQDVDVAALPTVDIEELAAELGVDTQR